MAESGLRMCTVSGHWALSLLAISIFEKYNKAKTVGKEEEGRDRYDKSISGVATIL